MNASNCVVRYNNLYKSGTLMIGLEGFGERMTHVTGLDCRPSAGLEDW